MHDIEYYKNNLDLVDLQNKIGDWRKRKGFVTNYDNIPEKLLLIHSEVSEAAEEIRKGNYYGFRFELADIIIRVLDLCDALKLNTDSLIAEKMVKNESREHRHGKKF